MLESIQTEYRSITPYLSVKGASEALEFYQRAFGAVCRPICLRDPDGKIVHAEMMIGDSIFMLAEESLESGFPSPRGLGGTAVKFALTVDDADTLVARAVKAGATLDSPVADQFYGERSGRVVDPYGHIWIIGTTTEIVSPEEMQHRLNKMYGIS